MNITDELMESVAKKCWHMLDADGYYELLAIVNHIEAEHRKALENVNELRELVRDMWFWGYEGHMDSKSQEWQMKHINEVLDRMHELRIEK